MDKPPCFGVVIPEAVVVKATLFVEVLALESQRVTDSFNHWRGQTVNTVFRLPGGFTTAVGQFERGTKVSKLIMI
ncbi:hypothetical protein ACQKP8_24610 [Photobacterium alginatilyticum]|uniref:hypothetical protein n=1 Tax=Photobacterium alginatilyticum TaxID=1775171 RepID=UPI004067CD24